MFFLHIRFSRLGVFLFLIEFLISRSWLALGLCVVCIASLSLEAGNTFVILSYFEANSKNVYYVVRFYTWTLISLISP